jgi:hypothetical protein
MGDFEGSPVLGFGVQVSPFEHPWKGGGGADKNSSCHHDIDVPSKAKERFLKIKYEGKCRFDTRQWLITHMSSAANATLPALLSVEVGKPPRTAMLILETQWRDLLDGFDYWSFWGGVSPLSTQASLSSSCRI